MLVQQCSCLQTVDHEMDQKWTERYGLRASLTISIDYGNSPTTPSPIQQFIEFAHATNSKMCTTTYEKYTYCGCFRIIHMICEIGKKTGDPKACTVVVGMTKEMRDVAVVKREAVKQIEGACKECRECPCCGEEH